MKRVMGSGTYLMSLLQPTMTREMLSQNFL